LEKQKTILSSTKRDLGGRCPERIGLKRSKGPVRNRCRAEPKYGKKELIGLKNCSSFGGPKIWKCKGGGRSDSGGKRRVDYKGARLTSAKKYDLGGRGASLNS